MNENMKKKMYKEPKMVVDAIGSDTFVMLQPSNSNVEPNFAPKRVVTPTNPVAPADTVQVF